MQFSKTYKINTIGISNEKLILNHFEEYLLNSNFIITDKRNTSINYQYKYMYIFSGLSLASRAKAGKLKVIVKNDVLEVKLFYTDYWMLIISLLMCGFMFYQLKQEFHNQIIFFPAVGFLWLFGVNFLIRYYAQKSIFKNIKEIINKLSI